MPHRFRHFTARHPGGGGSGRFGQEFMNGDDMGGRGFGLGRKLASVDLQLLVLGLLDEKPSHGYQIIKALGERSKGFYVPSPGMVYPALATLEEIGHATVVAEGARKLHSITALGAAHLERNRAKADALRTQLARSGDRMERVRRAMDADDSNEESASERRRGGSKELMRAGRDLNLAWVDKCESSREEQQRIAEILMRATAEILGR